jgi:hypothetical protein
MATEPDPVVSVYARGGYTFRIEVRVREYPWAAFKYWAKVTSVARHAAATTPIPLEELPFTPAQHHGASPEEAVGQVRRQIDDALS